MAIGKQITKNVSKDIVSRKYILDTLCRCVLMVPASMCAIDNGDIDNICYSS